MDLYLNVKKVIQDNHMIAAGDHVVLGLSGGADSVCLTLCLARLRTSLTYRLSAVHVHHGIRGEEADRDAAFARKLCERLGIPFELCFVDVPSYVREHGSSWEEAGRILRYRMLDDVCARDGAILALAHHMDDQAETVLMNLCRGTGIRGLGGIPAVHGNRIRPLLFVRRSEITAWLQQAGQDWIEDGSNASDEYTRNRIRRELVPWMTEKVNVRSVEHISSLAAQVRELDDYLESEAQRLMQSCIFRDGEDLLVSKVTLRGLPTALRGRILQRSAEMCAGAARDITSRHLEALDHLVLGDAGRKLDLPYGLAVYGEKDVLRFCRKQKDNGNIGKAGHADLSSVWTIRTEIFDYSGQKIPENKYTKWFDYAKIKGTVQIRARKSGDRFALAGGGHKEVRRWMIDEGIPAGQRDQIPLLVDAEDHVLWIVGHRMNAAYQVTEKTEKILAVTAEYRE